MKESVRLMRFAIVGTLNAMIIAFVVWLFMHVLHCNYIVSNVIAYAAALTNNFFWSKYWVFTSKDGRFMKEVPLFLIAFGCAFGSQFLALLAMVELLGMNKYLAQFLGLFLYGGINFIMNRLITFRGKKKALDEKAQMP